MFRDRPLKTASWLLVALGSLSAGAALSWHHPLWPMPALVIFGLWCLLVVWRPGVWLFAVPACLPFLNFSPWTGWLVFDEFDILLLGALAGGYGRLAGSSRSGARTRMPVVFWGLVVLLACTGLLALYRGFADAGGFAFDWLAGYGDPLNSLRVFKSLGFALLFVPLLQHEIARSRALAGQRLATGIVTGLTVATLAVVWERVAFPGLLDFSTNYRTAALFWEMHVGGAAIDAYLVLTAPFVVWALVSAHRPLPWAGAACLALLTGYACLTTFSRGVYLAVALSLVLLRMMLWSQKYDFDVREFLGRVWRRHVPEGWRAKAGLMLVLTLVTEVAVVGGGSFMTERLSSTDRDLSSRLAHWQHGIDLLDGPSDWLLGKGLGRLPANYAAHVPQGEFSGDVKGREEQESAGSVNGFVTVRGPNTIKTLGAQYALTQRVGMGLAGQHRVSLEVRVKNQADVYLELCERHLLYDRSCQRAFVRVLPGKTAWQALTLPLGGPVLAGGAWYAPRLGMFSLSVGNAGGVADFDNIRLIGPHREELLENGEFSRGLARWFPAAQAYFVPWHLDNLFLEVLVERGLAGLLLLAVLITYALWHLVAGRSRSLPLSPYLAASLCAALVVGLVSSFMDVPRVAFLYYLLTLYAIQTTQESE